MSNTLVVYGGTFDPPHVGHLQSYRWLREQGHDVVVVPALAHEYKPHTLPTYLYRLHMCRLAFGEDAVGDLESHVLRTRPLPIRSVDVMRASREWDQRTPRRVLFAVGPDVDVRRWTGIEEIEADGFDFVRVPNVDGVRSSLVRELASQGKPWRHLVVPAVAEYVEMHGLYGTRRWT